MSIKNLQYQKTTRFIPLRELHIFMLVYEIHKITQILNNRTVNDSFKNILTINITINDLQYVLIFMLKNSTQTLENKRNFLTPLLKTPYSWLHLSIVYVDTQVTS